MFLFQDEPTNPPFLVVVFVLFLIFAIFYALAKAANNIFRDYLDFFANKKYYNRNLLILASKVIKANGAVNKTEQEFVRKHFINNYGKRKANKAFLQLKKITLDKTSIKDTCKKVHDFLTYQERFDFVKFLFGIAYSDGNVTKDEELEIRKIASHLFLRKKDYEYLRSNFFKSGRKSSTTNYQQAYNYDYETIGVSKSATDIEIKKAYRALVKKYHPDKLVNVTQEDFKVAKEKFQKIQEAYNKIKNERGF